MERQVRGVSGSYADGVRALEDVPRAVRPGGGERAGPAVAP